LALAAQALIPIAGLPLGVGITCHQATWYWAALEAQALALTSHKLLIDRMVRIGNIPGSAQGAMLSLPRHPYDFANPGGVVLPLGAVLVWTAAPTHSAVVTANGIAGYNQACVFPHLPALGAYSCPQPAQLAPAAQQCFVVQEADVVRAAGQVFTL
jgi:hypothetical protein